ncbi:MAG: hypothetical protein WA622_28735 [Mycobacterium sp.]|uniref:hypothetical protein n=1 Tax=Mycobacterium sp. TaxID=1785 RepID=UPI003BB6368B
MAIAGLALLTAVAVVAAVVAVVQRGHAIEQRNAAIALRLVARRSPCSPVIVAAMTPGPSKSC